LTAVVEVDAAVTEAVTASGLVTADLGGQARTADVTRALCEHILGGPLTCGGR